MEERKYVIHLKGYETLSRDIVSDRGQLILAAGVTLGYSDIVRIKQIGILDVWIEKEEAAPEFAQEPQRSQPLPEQMQPHLQPQQFKALPLHIQTSYQSAVTSMKDQFEQAVQKGNIDVSVMQKASEELVQQSSTKKNFLDLLTNMRTHDEYTYQHSVSVGLLCRQIGTWIGLPASDCEDLLLGGTLLDIGKCRIPRDILNKTGRLTAEEFEQVKQHTTIGYDILTQSGVSDTVAKIAYNHHERLNGSGYPRGLQEEEIDSFSKIAAVADTFHAMISERAHQKAVSYYQVLEELQTNAYGLLDPQIVMLFVQKMTNFFVGNQVVLSDGTKGLVILTSSTNPTRPLIQTDGGFLNLEENRHLYIQQILSV